MVHDTHTESVNVIKSKPRVQCWNCKGDHFAKNCPQKKSHDNKPPFQSSNNQQRQFQTQNSGSRFQSTPVGSQPQRNRPFCQYCRRVGHFQDTCWDKAQSNSMQRNVSRSQNNFFPRNQNNFFPRAGNQRFGNQTQQSNFRPNPQRTFQRNQFSNHQPARNRNSLN